MASVRNARRPKFAHIVPEDISQETPDEEPARVLEPEPAEDVGFAKASKTEAVRIALSEGLDSPDDIQAFVRAKFGHDMPKPLISSYKSRLGGAKKQAVRADRTPQPAGKSMNKSEAARAAIDAGYDKPTAAVEYIQREFGIEMLPTHFSAIKSQYAKKQAAGKAKGKPGRKPRGAAPAVEGHAAPPAKQKPASGDGDLMGALEGVKGLVATYGADSVKKMVDLLS